MPHDPSAMLGSGFEKKILEFVGLLRRNGVRVTVAETLDGLAAVASVGIEQGSDFREALKACLVKRKVDEPAFDELFELFFRGLSTQWKIQETALKEALHLADPDYQALLEQLADQLAEWNIELSDLARHLLLGNSGELQRLLAQAASQIGLDQIERPFQEGRYAHSLAQALGLSGISAELELLKQAVRGSNLADEEKDLLQRWIERRLADLTALIKRTVRMELEKQDPTQRESQRLDPLGEKSFYYLTEDEIRRMKEAVTKLAERLKNVVALRRKRAKRGRFDVKATLRTNLQYGAVPFKLRFDRRVKDKPQIIVLCDVSDSVRNVSRFMLQFVYTLQDLYARVRSFVFVSELGEVTRLFEEQDIHTAIEQSLSGQVVNVFAHSDFGRAFRAFHRDYLSAVNKRTTVLILGDARNNYNLPHEWTLKEIKQRAKQVIWLNPENRLTWGFGDSEMDRYMPYCDLVEECRNLNQLYRVIDRLVR